MKRAAAALALALAAAPAAACQWCMQNNQFDGSSDAPPPAHVPASVLKAPKLDADDVAFVLALEDGKRYARLGEYLADKTVRDLWLRLLDESQIDEVLRPRGAIVVAAMRKKAAVNALAKDDYLLAAHWYRDLPAALSADDWRFLRDVTESAPAGLRAPSEPAGAKAGTRS